MIDPMNLEPTQWVHLCTIVGIHEDDWGDAWLHLHGTSGGTPMTEVDAIATLGLWSENRKNSQTSGLLVDELNGSR